MKQQKYNKIYKIEIGCQTKQELGLKTNYCANLTFCQVNLV